MNADAAPTPSWEEFQAAVAEATGFPRDDLARDLRFIEDLGFDSLQVMELLVMLIEDYRLTDLLGELQNRPWQDVTLGELYDEVAMRTGAE
jgi:acyl carrier protein